VNRVWSNGGGTEEVEKKLLLLHFVHHEPHLNSPEMNPGLDAEKLSSLWHGTLKKTQHVSMTTIN
jgi:hypothetical protein